MNNIKPFMYIGSKLNCFIQNGIIMESETKEYWSSCKQEIFLDAIKDETPEVQILYETEDESIDILQIERDEQIKVYARDNPDYFNLVYAGGGFGVSGDQHPAKRPEVRAHMKAANYMNRDDFRPWKASRAIPADWMQADIAYKNYVIINLSNHYRGKCGWRRLLSSPGINTTICTAKSMLKLFDAGWIPDEDPEFKLLKCSEQNNV